MRVASHDNCMPSSGEPCHCARPPTLFLLPGKGHHQSWRRPCAITAFESNLSCDDSPQVFQLEQFESFGSLRIHSDPSSRIETIEAKIRMCLRASFLPSALSAKPGLLNSSVLPLLSRSERIERPNMNVDWGFVTEEMSCLSVSWPCWPRPAMKSGARDEVSCPLHKAEAGSSMWA